MIKKIYRLKEKQVKKVLQKAKPFFSYNIVLNYMKNNQNINRYAIIISSKSVNTNVSRVYFRRLFYDIVSQNLQVNKT
jgi:ribonuclease P protein component